MTWCMKNATAEKRSQAQGMFQMQQANGMKGLFKSVILDTLIIAEDRNWAYFHFYFLFLQTNAL